MRSGAKVGIVGSVFVVVVGGIGYGAYNVWNGVTGGSSGSGSGHTTTQNAPARTGPVSGDEIKNTAKDFLAAWASGDPEKASQLTNNPVESQSTLASYKEDAAVTKMVVTPGAPVGAKVPYTVNATVSFGDVSKPWSYASALTVVRGQTTGRPLVDWQPTVVHPQLKTGQSIKTGEAAVAAIKAVDYRGRELTKEKYPSLGTILDQLRTKYGAKLGGKPGIETYITSDSPDAETAPDASLLTLTKGKPALLHTTLDADVQAAAERAVKQFPEASVAAVKPSTGEIRAVANHRTDGYNAAMLGKQAPGSTMKIVTAAMLIDNGLAGENKSILCPKNVVWQSQTFHNLDNFHIPDGTLATSFARSCNTAFIKPLGQFRDKNIPAETALSTTAKKYFGIGDTWHAGVPTSDGSVPAAQGPDQAAAMIGQGQVTMNPLNMASITATAKSGTFRQPVIVPRSLINEPIASTRSMPQNIARQLGDMLHTTATAGYGTATGAMSGVGGYKGAKTGSAEVDAQGKSNSWFTGFSDDLAAAAVVQSGGHGGTAAGPVVAAVLRAG
ncbi:penicillin-binding transpeptidase domain-containing protein [Streptomyces beijiangensis]|uniref:Penicillin-binding protein n=1 Tax=Streptomyces beijiangensis TaxID=163361 RepID=A0A939F8N9_9ACTN|nr:penicillin-binding transpeptidase domain-containing protein [Streptomyces beijiangensis]MBO0514656.1 penicillin-binding protein [Streptomyces beijiangensis]